MTQEKPKAGTKKRPRTCVGCGEESQKKALLRVVRTPEGQVKHDPTGKANGRGVYVCADLDCLKLAKKKNAFSRMLKSTVSEELYGELSSLIGDKPNEQAGAD